MKTNYNLKELISYLNTQNLHAYYCDGSLCICKSCTKGKEIISLEGGDKYYAFEDVLGKGISKNYIPLGKEPIIITYSDESKECIKEFKDRKTGCDTISGLEEELLNPLKYIIYTGMLDDSTQTKKLLTSKREFKSYKQLIEYENKPFLVELGIEFETMLSGDALPCIKVIKIREVDLEEKFEE